MSPGLRQGLVAKSASTVWLLDDDPSVLKATGRLLASAGWEVERFIDPDAFLRHAEIHHPRVVVIDMWMQRMDGLEVQRRLSGISPSTRVIVLTASDDRIVRWKALAAGAAAFFIKPECGDEFLAGVRSAFACRHHGARHERSRGALSLEALPADDTQLPRCGNS
jgi:FixJ family two-component response regulator